MMHWTPKAVKYFLVRSLLKKEMWKNMEKYGKTAMAGLGKYSMSGYGRIGVYRVKGYIFLYLYIMAIIVCFQHL